MAKELHTDPLLRNAPEVDGYRVLEPAVLYARVGEGGMGAVYRGRHANLNVDVAVKVLNPSLATEDPEFVARFRREAELAASISHQNLIRVFDVKQSHGLHYLVMEYVEGETALERVARKGALGAVEALDIVLAAARGLGAAHSEGVVHRDVKPENILIDGRGRVKVADLGLAKAAAGPERVTRAKVRMGTPRYMPPEQWEDARSVGPPGDVWALGATFYFLLTGQHAIADGSLTEIFKRVCVDEFPDVRKKKPHVPDPIVRIIERCTQKRTTDRYADAAELAEALQEFRKALQTPPQLPDERAGKDTTRMAPFTPPPARTMAKVVSAPPEPPGLLPTLQPGRSKKLWIAVGAGALVLGVVAWLILKPGGGGNGQSKYEIVRMLEGEVKVLRERLERTPQLMRDRVGDTQDEEERALFRKLEDLARGLLQSDELRQIDATISAGSEMLKDRELDQAKSAFEKAKTGIEGLIRRPAEEEARFRAQRLLGEAEDLQAKVTAIYHEGGITQDAVFAKAVDRLKTASEKFRSGRFQDSHGAAKDAVTAWQEAKAHGEKLATAAKGSMQALAAAKAADGRWRALKEAEGLAEGDDISTARKKIAEGEKALEGGDLVAAMDSFQEATRLLEGAIEQATRRIEARRDATAARERARQARAAWERIAATGVGVPDEVRTAQQALDEAEEHFGKGEFSDAVFAYRVAELGFSKAAEKFGGKVPEGWTLVENSGPGEWARRVADPRTGIVFILVQPGAFEMGSAEGRGDTDEHPRRTVRITRPYYLAETETTVGQWRKFADAASYKTEAERGDGGYTLEIGGTAWQRDQAASWKNPMPALTAAVDDRCPVTQVSWNDALKFCSQFGYRLPTEAEWEYACRAGTDSEYWWGDGEAGGTGKGNFGDVAAQGKFATWGGFSFSDGQVYPAPVKSFDVNPWGFADMLGNVWEWCADGYDRHFYGLGIEEDPAQAEGIYRVLRGGAWCAGPGVCRSATRNANGPSLRFDFAGFRVVKDIE